MRLSLFALKQCIIKQLLDSVFVISEIIKVSVSVISLSLRLTLNQTLKPLDGMLVQEFLVLVTCSASPSRFLPGGVIISRYHHYSLMDRGNGRVECPTHEHNAITAAIKPGRMVREPDLKYAGRKFKSHSDHLAGVVSERLVCF